MNKQILLLGFFVLCLADTAVGADDFGADLTTSIQALPASVDLAGMGGLNICAPTPSGGNPAQYPTLEEFHFKMAPFFAGYGINFRDGPKVLMSINTITTKIEPGFLRLNYYRISSAKPKSKSFDFPQNVEGETFEIGYGLKLSDKLNLGMSLMPLIKSYSEARLGRFKIGSGKAESEFTMTLGALYRPVKRISLGVYYSCSLQKIKSEEFGFGSEERVSADFLRLGLAVQPWTGATFGVEWLGGRVNNEKPKRDVYPQEWFFGGEQWLNKHLAVRAGSFDGGLTAGLGVALGKKPSCFIDYAFLANPAGPMRSYWGEGNAHLVSLCWAF